MGVFSGTLRTNEIFGALFNMIISQEVFADNIKGTNSRLVDAARVDGSLYGDTKLYYATDVLKSVPWGVDANHPKGGVMDVEAANLLALDRPDEPKCQAIYLDVFRQIRLTSDSYMSKRAWATEGAFQSFNSVMLGWMRDTKRVYDSTIYNSFIGTTQSQASRAVENVNLYSITETGLDKDKKEAMTIAQTLADLIVDMTDISRDFNDYGFLRSYDESEIKVIWNSKWVNKIRKIDLPTIFNNEGLVDKFDEYRLPSRFFGQVQTAQVAATDNDGSYRSLLETDYTTPTGVVHVFAGDLIPSGIIIPANASYVEDPNVICKILTKLPPYMSAFEVGTSFFNPRSLTENHYTTFGHNSLEYLYDYPLITVKAITEDPNA